MSVATPDVDDVPTEVLERQLRELQERVRRKRLREQIDPPNAPEVAGSPTEHPSSRPTTAAQPPFSASRPEKRSKATVTAAAES
ncbi:hypothetical protein HK405_005072, partial [Cladochytrium tenue]